MVSKWTVSLVKSFGFCKKIIKIFFNIEQIKTIVKLFIEYPYLFHKLSHEI